jgi:DNA topoisomerase III
VKKIVLTEKPSVAKSFASTLKARRVVDNDGYFYENGEYIIVFCFGHMMRLLNPDEISNEYKTWKANYIEPEYFEKRCIEESQEQTLRIARLIQRVDVSEIIIATDAGREGENIAREVIEFALKERNKEITLKRFWTSDVLSENVIKKTLQNLYDATKFEGLYDAAKARERSDWLIGFNATRAFTSLYSKGSGTLSIGRVQTPVLALIVDREDQILHFKEEAFYNLVAKNSALEAKAINSELESKGDKFAFFDKQKVEALKKRCEQKSFTVTSVTKKSKKSYPAKLFSIATLQQSANKVYGYAPEETLSIAQSLYEKRFITYPRTDSEVLGNEEKNDAKIRARANSILSYVAQGAEKTEMMLGVDAVGLRIFNPKKLTDHHAILPAYKEEWANDINTLSEAQRTIFELIATRFIEAFLPPLEMSESEAILDNSQTLFIAKAKEVIVLGFMAFSNSEQKNSFLNLAKGDVLDLSLSIDELCTSIPKRYTQGEMIGVMSRAHRYIDSDDEVLKEALKNADGLGTGATRDKFLPLLEKRTFIEIKNNIIFPTKRGVSLIELLIDSPITSPIISALMELELKKLEQGNSHLGLDGFILKSSQMAKELIKYAQNQQHNQLFSNSKSHYHKEIKSLGKCPACSSGDVVATPKAYGCSDYRNGCKFTIWFNTLAMMGHKIIKESEIKKLLKGSTLLKLKHKDGRLFEAECALENQDSRWRVKVNFDQKWKAEVLGKCPLCKSDLVESPKAYGCSMWKEGCGFKVFKDALGRFGGRKIAKTNFKKLLSSGSFITKLKRKNGDEYEAPILLDLDYGVKVDFANAK